MKSLSSVFSPEFNYECFARIFWITITLFRREIFPEYFPRRKVFREIHSENAKLANVLYCLKFWFSEFSFGEFMKFWYVFWVNFEIFILFQFLYRSILVRNNIWNLISRIWIKYFNNCFVEFMKFYTFQNMFLGLNFKFSNFLLF